MIPLSNAANKLIGQPMFELLAKARSMEKTGKKITHYEIGDPIFDTPINIVEAAKNALDKGMTHYTNSGGLPDFIEKIRKHIEIYYGFYPTYKQVVVCTANAIIDFVCRLTTNPGEEIIYPDPGFPTYHSVIIYNDFIPVPVPLKEENDFRMQPKDIKDRITNKTRLIIINSSHNPTGSVINPWEIEEICDIAENNNIYLLSDEVYSRIVYDRGFVSPSLKDKCLERTIILSSMSKIYSMSGWRLGYVVGPECIMEKMALLIQTIISCFPPFIQIAGAEALYGKQDDVKKRLHQLLLRRDILVRGLNSLEGVKCNVPHGAFYAFPNITGTGLTSDEYCDKLLKETGVCVLPGNCFGDCGEGYVRLCYASVDFTEIIESIEKMKIFHSNLGVK
jgi:aspartate/methionine/tyrosine aminotransferase